MNIKKVNSMTKEEFLQQYVLNAIKNPSIDDLREQAPLEQKLVFSANAAYSIIENILQQDAVKLLKEQWSKYNEE